VFPIYIRTPSLLAMTAARLDFGVRRPIHSGIGHLRTPVMEGFHGVEFDAPIGRTREIVEICRQVWRRERVQYDASTTSCRCPRIADGFVQASAAHQSPCAGRIPVTIAALARRMIELTAEIAEAGSRSSTFRRSRHRLG